MFTGIVTAVGTIAAIKREGGRRLVTVRHDGAFPALEIGESIAVGGVCLTVGASDTSSFTAQVLDETWRKTAFMDRAAGDAVNLERALAADGRLGGHFVLGHVDETAAVVAIKEGKNDVVFTFEAPAGCSNYLVEKGSVALDGVSLTCFNVKGLLFSVAMIRHTREATTFKHRRSGDRVNFEADVLGKYVAKLLAPDRARELYRKLSE